MKLRSGKNLDDYDLKLEAQEAKLEQCVVNAHAEISKVWPKSKDVARLEPLESCILAHNYYRIWMPYKLGASNKLPPVKLMIMAESHSSTNSSIVGAPCSDALDESLHIGHLNLIHSLSYGESWLLSEEQLKRLPQGEQRAISGGTKQFWRSLSAVGGELDVDGRVGSDYLQGKNVTTEDLNAAFSHIEGAKKDDTEEVREERLAAKITLVHKLRERGILLVDTSPVPIYTGGGVVTRFNKKTGTPYKSRANKLPVPVYKKVIEVAWHLYAKHLIQHYRPENVLMFGINVEKAIGKSVIEEEVNSVGGLYLGATQHPSYNKIQGYKFTPSLIYLRDVGKAVANGKKAPLVPVLPTTAKKKKSGTKKKRKRKAVEKTAPLKKSRK